jgi:hypothetical protein
MVNIIGTSGNGINSHVSTVSRLQSYPLAASLR